jgi:hypothetical protein
MSDATPTTRFSAVRAIAAAAAIIVGIVLLVAPTTPAVADGLFVGSIALLLAIYVWPGLPGNTPRLVAIVLILLAAYAFVRGFGLLELSILRQLGGGAAILFGIILLVPVIRGIASRGRPAAE